MVLNNTSIIDKSSDSASNRTLNINVPEGKMEAYITITYSLPSNNEESKGQHIPLYTMEELKEALNKAGIVYGIIQYNLEKCLDKRGADRVLIAKGSLPIDGADDMLDIKFDVDKDIRKLNEDSSGRVDYKSIGAINSVNEGDVLAVKIPGKEGIDGKDVYGKIVKCKAPKKIKLRAIQGCKMKDENTIIASISGKPCMKNNAFYVYSTHEVSGDVDLKTGNVTFLGDIIIKGNVREGMKVKSGNSIAVFQNVLEALIEGKSDINIKGNVISSTIIGGGEDTDKLKEIEVLEKLKNSLNDMISSIEEIKKFNLLGYNVSDGQIVKILIENKFKSIPRICLPIISHIVKSRQNDDIQGEFLLALIKNKLLGLAPLNIKHYSELFEMQDAVNERLEYLKTTLSLPVNVKLFYCQDSTVNSSGDIIISGRGSYVSALYAHGRVHFMEETSVVRGGSVKAGREINCKNAGSTGGVPTKLIVGEEGHIYVRRAYENTIFVVGGREFVLNYASKDVHAYLNDEYELIVDKLRL